MKFLSLVIAVGYAVGGLYLGVAQFLTILAWVACCLPVIWIGDRFSGSTGMLYVAAITGESPRALIRQAGWVFLLLPGAMMLLGTVFGY